VSGSEDAGSLGSVDQRQLCEFSLNAGGVTGSWGCAVHKDTLGMEETRRREAQIYQLR
jgi:hypothetical protein